MKETRRILVVDDDAATLRATSRILKSAGYHVTEASTGADGLRLAREQLPDLVLLDVVMNDMSGVQVCQHIKADPQLANVFVVLLSSIKTDSDSQAQGLEAGADSYIARPIANRELVARVQALLRIKAAEDALRASEERFRTVADFTYDWEYWIGVDGKHVYVSPSCERITGYRAEEFMQDPGLLRAIIHPDDHARLDSHQHQVRGRDHPATFDFRIITRGGEERWINHVCQPVRGTGGRGLGRRASNRDITDHKRAEDALQRMATEYRTLAENSPDLIARFDKSLRHAYVNPMAARAGRFSADEYVGKTIAETGVPEPVAEVWEQRIRRVLETGQMIDEVDAFPTPEGTRYFHTRLAPERASDGSVHSVLSVARDITERTRAEENLRALSARHQATLAAVPDIIMEVDNNKVYTWANQAGFGFFGAEVIGKQAAFYFEGEQETYNVVQPLFNGNEDVIYVESWQRRHDGEKRLLGWWCRTLKDAQGNVTGALSTAHDITEHKRAQAALKEYSERLEQMVDERTRELRDAQEQLLRQERLTTLGQVAGGISHELRGPLGAIKNAVYLLNLAHPSPDAETAEILQILKQQVANSERIITSLMDYARPQPPHRCATDVRATIESALAQSALPVNIMVHQQYDANLPTLMADPDQLEIVFGNLIRNAVQAMPEDGQLTIDARQTSQTSQVPQDFGSLEISFRDTGVGIAPEILDKIFQPLFSTKARGMGLGLALCKLLIEGHNGRIQVTSQVGKGTTFTICLPMT